jgi:hypothetical protein
MVASFGIKKVYEQKTLVSMNRDQKGVIGLFPMQDTGSTATPFVQNEYGKLWFYDGIAFLVYNPGIAIDISIAQKMTDILMGFHDKPFPLYCDARNLKSMDKQARDHFANVGYPLKCIAIIIDSPVDKIIGNFFLGVSKPITPTRLFSDEGAALKYLKSFIG